MVKLLLCHSFYLAQLLLGIMFYPSIALFVGHSFYLVELLPGISCYLLITPILSQLLPGIAPTYLAK